MIHKIHDNLPLWQFIGFDKVGSDPNEILEEFNGLANQFFDLPTPVNFMNLVRKFFKNSYFLY